MLIYAPARRGVLRAYEARDKYHRLRAMGNDQAPISFPFVLAKRERNGRLTGQRKGKALYSKPSYMVIVLVIYADSGAYRFRFAAADGCDCYGLLSEKNL